MERNAKFFLDNAEQTENGRIYRDKDYKTAPDDAIVYMGEYDLDDVDTLVNENKKNPTEKELFEHWLLGSSKNSIRIEIKDYYPNATDEWIDRHDLISKVIEACSWEGTATIVDQMDDWDEIWEDYPEES